MTINTDNMTVSNTSLKREYQLLKETFQLSEEMLLQLAENSVEAAFLPLKKKVKLEQKVKQEFLKWLSTERI
ncbi:adenosine deaminase [Firmicutes bacterium CAG:227]|nr:adenosine deaminase [Firmicutes bacterium CAG:227]